MLSNAFVVILGVSVVFIGLVCIVLLCKIVSAVCMLSEGKKPKPEQSASSVSLVANKPVENRQEIIAAISACLAEELGTDISAIRILSFKQI